MKGRIDLGFFFVGAVLGVVIVEVFIWAVRA